MSAKPTWVEAVHDNVRPLPAAPDRPLDARGRPWWRRHGSGLILALNGACLAATVTLGATTLAAWQPLRELRQIDDRLTALSAAEERLGGKIDRSDAGVLQRIEGLNQGIQGLKGDLGQIRMSVDESVGMIRETSAGVDEALATALVAASEMADAERRTAEARAAAEAGEDAADLGWTVPSPSASPLRDEVSPPRFERRELPNGSVAYSLR